MTNFHSNRKFSLCFELFIFSIDLREQLVDHGWCFGISTRLTLLDIDDFDHIEKTINAMVPLMDMCHRELISLASLLDKLKSVYSKTYLSDDSIYSDVLNNIEILLTKLRQRSSDDL